MGGKRDKSQPRQKSRKNPRLKSARILNEIQNYLERFDKYMYLCCPKDLEIFRRLICFETILFSWRRVIFFLSS